MFIWQQISAYVEVIDSQLLTAGPGVLVIEAATLPGLARVFRK